MWPCPILESKEDSVSLHMRAYGNPRRYLHLIYTLQAQNPEQASRGLFVCLYDACKGLSCFQVWKVVPEPTISVGCPRSPEADKDLYERCKRHLHVWIVDKIPHMLFELVFSDQVLTEGDRHERIHKS